MSAPIAADQVVFDQSGPFPLLGQARRAAEALDWPGIVAAYHAAGDWPMRDAVVWAVAEVAPAEQLLRDAARAAPEDPVPNLMLAVRLIEVGWQIRTGKGAKYVSAAQFAALHEHLRAAERLLIDVTARHPECVAAWRARLTTARGLELGQSEARRRYDQLAKYEPHDVDGQRSLLQKLCPKWGGSMEAMLAFAREKAFAAPEGSLNAVLIVDAHLEQWLDRSGKARTDYLRSAEVRDEVRRAAAYSVLSPAFRPVYDWVGVHSDFALFHTLAGDPTAAAVHFRAMGPFGAVARWGYAFADPRAMFLKHRAEALAKG